MERIYCDSSTREYCVVLPNQIVIHPYFSQQTNNTGEYLAAIAAVKLARQSGITDFCIYTDSNLVVRQTKGQNKCNSTKLWPLCKELRALLGADHIHLSNLKIEWISREQNPAGKVLEQR